MRMLLDVSKHTIPELELRVRHGKRLLEAANKRAIDAHDTGDINARRMHLGYMQYIGRCVHQAQNEIDRRKT